MDEYKTVLCGGTFLILLVQHRHKNANRAPKESITEGTSEASMFWQLCSVLDPAMTPGNDQKFLNNLKTQVREYKQCNQNAVSLIPITKGKQQDYFRYSSERKYVDARKRMKTYIVNKLNNDHNDKNLLVAAILETIKNDKSINDNEIFYCLEKSPHSIKKHDLLKTTNFDLASFLLGILYYIFTKPVINTLGKATFNSWMRKEKTENNKIQYRFCSDIGIEFANENPNLVKIPNSQNDGYSSEMQNIEDFHKSLAIKTKEHYEKLNTVNNIYEQKRFDDIFICNDLIPLIGYTNKIHEVTIKKLADISYNILITGSAGIGKTMMMKHLLLDACEYFDIYKKLPIYIPLSSYQDPREEITHFFFRHYKSISGFSDETYFLQKINEGNLIFLLDGLDEIHQENLPSFAEKFELFTSEFNLNIFIVSSRNGGNTTFLNNFITYKISPFTLEQAESLIDKIALSETKDELKEKIKEDIFLTYNAFTKTPLFLTLMIKNYAEFKDIPKKQHIYFDRLYKQLFRGLDKAKGIRKRHLLTGLNEKEFETYFSEFCAASYLSDKSMFSEYEFDHIFNQLSKHKENPDRVADSDFKEDLIENLGLMIYENDRICFWHKSFQEYFCALYYSTRNYGYLKDLVTFFEKAVDQFSYEYNVLTIFTSMISDEKYDFYVTLPYLTLLFKTCAKGDGYWTYLERIYQNFSYKEKNVSFIIFSPVFRELLFKEDFSISSDNLKLPVSDDFLDRKWVYFREDYCNPDCPFKNKWGYPCFKKRSNNLLDIADHDCRCRYNYTDSDIVSEQYLITFRDVFLNQSKYHDLFLAINSDDFPLKQEYHDLYEQWNYLFAEYARRQK